MIRAKFIKAVPTEEGITYTLKGASDKTALHSAVDMQGEECIIGFAEGHKKEETTPTFLLVMRDMIQKALRDEYERGLQDATQGNLLPEERGEQK